MSSASLPTRALVVCAALAACAGENADLTSAIDGGAGRRPVRAALTPVALEWTDLKAAQPGNDTLRFWPAAICMTDDHLVVADGSRRRLLVTSIDGTPQATYGGVGTGPGQFVEVTTVRCGSGSAEAVAGDLALRRLSLFDLDGGGYRSELQAPQSPQVQVIGDLAPGPAGAWYASWLGTRVPLGPYLSASEWKLQPLAQEVRPSGDPGVQIGRPAVYADPVATRVFNRTFLAARGDSLWVLTQGDAAIRGFTADGREVKRILLPIHHRGREPKISVGQPFSATSGFRASRLEYHPNVQGLAIVGDSLFATIRYRDWGYTLVGKGLDVSVQSRPKSAIEIYDRAGRALQSFAVPGFATEVVSDGRSAIAVLTSTRDGMDYVLLASVPPRPGPAAGR